MGDDADPKEELIDETERRSSVRVRTLLPCALRPIEEEEVPAVESRILDRAVLTSGSSYEDDAMWDERSDDLRREVVLLLNEIRALRQKVTELERHVERGEAEDLEERWISINDSGFSFSADSAGGHAPGDLLEVRLQLPSVHTQRILAVGEILRVDEDEAGPAGERAPEDGAVVAVGFQSISEIHEKAIMRYALLRERQIARSERMPNLK